MKLSRSLPCLAAAIACLLMPLTVVYGQTTTPPIPIATGSIACKMFSADPGSGQSMTETSTFDQVVLQKYMHLNADNQVIYVSYGVTSRWGTADEVMYDIWIADPVPAGTTVAPMSGSFIDKDDIVYYIAYDELGQLTFKLDGKGRLTVTGTSFAMPPNHFISVPEGMPTPVFGTCAWNLKGNV